MTLYPIARGYDLWACTYDREKNFLVDFERLNQIKRDRTITEYVEKRQKALDLGCGTGRHLNILEKRFTSVVGLDVSKGMLAAARKKRSNQRTKLVCGDFLKKVLKDRFDFINCSLALMHFSDLDLFFSKIVTNLDESGVLYLVDASEELLKRGSSPNFDLEDKTVSVNFHVHTLTAVKKAAEKAGLEILDFERMVFDEGIPLKLAKYERYRGLPCLYSIVARKPRRV